LGGDGRQGGFYTQPAGTAVIEVYGTSGPSALFFNSFLEVIRDMVVRPTPVDCQWTITSTDILVVSINGHRLISADEMTNLLAGGRDAVFTSVKQRSLPIVPNA
jgi:hypothetical protein